MFYEGHCIRFMFVDTALEFFLRFSIKYYSRVTFLWLKLLNLGITRSIKNLILRKIVHLLRKSLAYIT